MIDETVHSPKKLIEVTLPLDAINAACVREKSIRHGHPSTMHLWWARRPLAAARAVIFASMVNDPGYVNKEFRHGVNKEEAEKKRAELCKIIEDLVKWENTNNPEVLKRARDAMMESWREICRYNKNHPRAKELFDPEKLPAFHDPFAGGGALPLEAQRLGLESFASDLNPVPVLINKGMIEIPPKFRGKAPSGPLPAGETEPMGVLWEGNQGLAEDIRRYGLWMREKAKEKIGKYYPDVEITEEMAEDRPDLKPLVGQKFPVIAWIWARTVKSPNPLYADKDVPLASTFVLSKKKGNEAYIEPVIKGNGYEFHVRRGICPESLRNGTKVGRGSNFNCILSGSAITDEYVKAEGKAGGLGSKLMAVVVDGPKGRMYLDAFLGSELMTSKWEPETKIPVDPKNLWVVNYGLEKYKDLFSERQRLALSTFSDLISNELDDQAETVIKKAEKDAVKAGLADDHIPLCGGGVGARAYAEAICLYMAFVVDKCSDYWSTICTWHNSKEQIRNTFGRQAIPMTWDFAETNPFSEVSGSWLNMLTWVSKAVGNLPISFKLFSNKGGNAVQAAAQTQSISQDRVVSTDPPYYDNVGYADLSDYFYVWLRKNVKGIFPDVCGTLSTPKHDELIASQYRQGSKQKAEDFFLNGMTEVMSHLAGQAHPAFPVTIYYAFKQSETKAGSTTNTGWVTFLEAVIRAGFQITGTWPMRTEMANRTIGIGTNALASSIVLVCRRRPVDAPSISTKQFKRELNARLAEALEDMVSGERQSSIAPVDLSQAIIGPGMEIFSRYNGILESDGTQMSVDKALRLINNFLDEDAFDPDTQFCFAWFKAYQWQEADFGTANQIAMGKGLSVEELARGGVLNAGKGKVQLIHWKDLPADWDPETDKHTSLWEICHHLIRAYQVGGGVDGAARLLAKIELKASVPMFCSTMYTLCERNAWSEDAMAYNSLSVAWSSIESRAAEFVKTQPKQLDLL